nr:hypothetical protein [uncultured Holophaga sp.]
MTTINRNTTSQTALLNEEARLDEEDAPRRSLKGATSNPKPRTHVEVKAEIGGMVYYRPDTGELLVVPPDKGGAMKSEIDHLDKLISDFTKAKANYLKRQEAYQNDAVFRLSRDFAARELISTEHGSVPSAQKPTPIEARKLAAARDKAAEAFETAQKELKKELKPFAESGKVLELIPIGATGPDGNKWIMGKKMTYVRSDKVANHWRAYKLNEKETTSAEKSFLRNGKIDTKKLKEQFALVLKVKAEKEFPWLQGVFKKELNERLEKSIGGWAEAWNKDHDHIQFGAEARVLRYFVGASTSAEWDLKKGNVSLKAGAKGDFALAEGKFTTSLYLPSKAGWHWTMYSQVAQKTYPMALVRATAELAVEGFVGGSVALEANLEVECLDPKTSHYGVKGAPHETLKKPGSLDISKKPSGKGASASADAEVFVGVRAGGSVTGKMEWWSSDPADKGFKTLASIAPGVAAMAGAGAGAHAEITFKGGKFRVKASAAACWGLGAKGSLEYVVDALQTMSFWKFLAQAYYHVKYDEFKIVDERAAKAWRYLTFEMINGYSKLKQRIIDTESVLEIELLKFEKDVMDRFGKEVERTRLMKAVLAKPEAYKFAPPETKGMILYQMTRHSVATELNPLNRDARSLWDWDLFPQRKEAAMEILRWAQSKQSFWKIIRCMDPIGEEGNFDQREAEIRQFLSWKGDSRHRVDQYLRDYTNLRAALEQYIEPVFGSPLVPNDSPVFMARLTDPYPGPYRNDSDLTYV